MAIFGCASDEQFLDELKEGNMKQTNNPIINHAKSYCKKALKLFRSSGYACPEIARYYHSALPDNLTLMQIQHCYAVYHGFSSWSDMCKFFFLMEVSGV